MTAFLFFLPVTGQVDNTYKSKLFDTWIRSDPGQRDANGVLYSVTDSSIIISSSRFKKDYLSDNFSLSTFNYNSIDRIQIRRNNSVIRGLVTGGLLGFGLMALSSTAMANEVARPGEKGAATLFFLVAVGIPVSGVSAGIGALIGSVKKNYPIGRSYENFSAQRNNFRNFAYLKKEDSGYSAKDQNLNLPGQDRISNVKKKRRNSLRTEHRNYAGAGVGPSFPLGQFGDKADPVRYAKTGYSSAMEMGFLFYPKTGISLILYNNQYTIGNGDLDNAWIWAGLMAGPLFSFQVSRKIVFDLKPRIGFGDVTYYISESDQTSSDRFCINPAGSFRYNFTERWSVLAETNYMGTLNKADLEGIQKFQAFNQSFGIAYRFR